MLEFDNIFCVVTRKKIYIHTEETVVVIIQYRIEEIDIKIIQK